LKLLLLSNFYHQISFLEFCFGSLEVGFYLSESTDKIALDKNEQTESVKTLEPPLSTSLIYFLFFSSP
jgi:hypothetical protein